MRTVHIDIDMERYNDALENLSNIGSRLRGKIGNHSAYEGMLRISTALCKSNSDPQFHVYNHDFNPNGAMEDGLELLHRGFLDYDLPLKVGPEFRGAASAFHKISSLFLDAQNHVAPLPGLEINKAEKEICERACRMMHSTAKGFELIGTIPIIKEAGNGDASEYAMLLLRNDSLKAISWARIFNSDDAYVKYKALSNTEEFRSMSDSKKLGILLQNNEFKMYSKKELAIRE